MGAQQPHSSSSNAAASVFAWLLNVSSSVAIVFVNKVLMHQRGNYRFTFACTLSAIHFLTAAACIKGAQLFRPAEEAAPRLPWKDTLFFAVVAVVSIGSLNLSLLVNPVGLYQVAKLLIIPFVCAVEFLHPQIQRRFTPATVVCIATVVVGVAVVTVNDLGSGATHTLGVMVAGVSVVSSGMQQILCGTMQRQHKLQSHQLLAATSPVQGAMLLLAGPWVDAAVSGNWIGQYQITSGAVGVLLLSCAISVAVNLSQFMCLGRFSAVTFQVLGHTKTILVLLISWLVLGEAMGSKKLAGMAVAVAGMIAYSYFMTLGSARAKPAVSNSSNSDGRSPAPGGDEEDAADALELGRARERRGDHKVGQKKQQKSMQEEGDGSDVPLLRVVSRDNAEWSGDSVKVVVVERPSSSKQGNR